MVGGFVDRIVVLLDDPSDDRWGQITGVDFIAPELPSVGGARAFKSEETKRRSDWMVAVPRKRLLATPTNCLVVKKPVPASRAEAERGVRTFSAFSIRSRLTSIYFWAMRAAMPLCREHGRHQGLFGAASKRRLSA